MVVQTVIAMPSRSAQELLVVVDFDWSLIECNSDFWILEQLHANAPFQR